MHNSSYSQYNDLTVGVLGCGWLGMPLAKKLLDLGYSVRGSRRSEQGVAFLEENGIQGYKLNVGNSEMRDQYHFFDHLDVLCICLPPGLRKNPNSNFLQKMEILIPYLSNAKIKHILYTSSISVYGDLTGIINETSPTEPTTQSGKQILATEKLLLKHFHKTLTIVRLGGLIGEDRHPLHILSKKESIPQGNSPINLIHQIDAVNALVQCIQKPFHKSIFNLVSPYHPSKEKYYTTLAKQWNIRLPRFLSSGDGAKQVSSQLLTDQYDFKFEVEKLLID